jgi:hypothetical protein
MHKPLAHSLLFAAALAGCESPTPVPTDAAVGTDAAMANDAPTTGDDAFSADAFSPIDAFAADDAINATDAAMPACMPMATDFPGAADYTCTTVRSALASMPDAFPYVVSFPGTTARSMAFQTMRDNGYFDYSRDPAAMDFVTMQDLYLGGGSGLASRVDRRFDPHYPTPDATGVMTRICQTETLWRANPEFCIGPSTLSPIILDNLARGQRADASEPLRNRAARIEAAITWFLHVSTYKEALTCAVTYPGGDGSIDNCDSSWAYYAGGADRPMGIGYSEMVRPLEPETHEAIWDALLAVRCWREMDPSDPDLQDPNMLALPQQAFFDRAHAQLDRALDRGMVVVLMDRLRTVQTTTGAERDAHLVFLRTILAPHAEITLTDAMGMSTTYPAGPSLFDHTIREVDATAADFIRDEIAQAPDDIDIDGIISRLDAAFPCP